MFALKQTVGLQRLFTNYLLMRIFRLHRLLLGLFLSRLTRVQVVVTIISSSVPLHPRPFSRIKVFFRVVPCGGGDHQRVVLFRYIRGHQHISVFMSTIGHRVRGLFHHVLHVGHVVLHRLLRVFIHREQFIILLGKGSPILLYEAHRRHLVPCTRHVSRGTSRTRHCTRGRARKGRHFWLFRSFRTIIHPDLFVVCVKGQLFLYEKFDN